MKQVICILLILLYGCGITKKETTDNIDKWTEDLTYISTMKQATSNIKNILVLGNSVSFLPVSNTHEWSIECGMSASSRDNDYVHILAKELSANVTVLNIADFERDFNIFDITTFNVLYSSVSPDLVIIQVGENVSMDISGFGTYYGKLLDLFPNVIAVGFGMDLIKKKNIAEDMRHQCMSRDISYIDIHLIGRSNSGEYSHPNDNGHKLIAEKIYQSML